MPGLGWVQAVAGLSDRPALVLAGSGGWDDEVDAALAGVPHQLRVVRPGWGLRNPHSANKSASSNDPLGESSLIG